MDPLQFFGAEKSQIATAAAAGSFVALLQTKKFTTLHAIALFVVGQVSAYYFTIWLAHLLGKGADWYGVVGFTIGALAMLFWGFVIALWTALRDDPLGTLKSLWRIWRGGAGGGGSQ